MFGGQNESIFAANQRPAVFKNHQFMIMEVDFGIDPGEYKAYYNWFTENVMDIITQVLGNVANIFDICFML